MECKQLVEGLIARDESAWRAFLDGYGRMIYSVAVKLDLDSSSRDDLFQETCLTILGSIGNLRDPIREFRVFFQQFPIFAVLLCWVAAFIQWR